MAGKKNSDNFYLLLRSAKFSTKLEVKDLGKGVSKEIVGLLDTPNETDTLTRYAFLNLVMNLTIKIKGILKRSLKNPT